MKKKTLETFIKKYYLSGSIEKVKWKIDATNKTLIVSAISEDRSVISIVTLQNFSELPDTEFGIFDTTKLLKLISILDDDIKIELDQTNNKLTGAKFTDVSTSVFYGLADLSVIPKSLTIKTLPEFNVEILIDEDFTKRYIAAKNALSDTPTFTVLMNKKDKLEFVIGYSVLNSNKIKLQITTTQDKDKIARNIYFDSLYLKEILGANKESKATILKISDGGLAMLEFQSPEYTSTYFLNEIKKVD